MPTAGSGWCACAAARQVDRGGRTRSISRRKAWKGIGVEGVQASKVTRLLAFLAAQPCRWQRRCEDCLKTAHDIASFTATVRKSVPCYWGAFITAIQPAILCIRVAVSIWLLPLHKPGRHRQSWTFT